MSQWPAVVAPASVAAPHAASSRQPAVHTLLEVQYCPVAQRSSVGVHATHLPVVTSHAGPSVFPTQSLAAEQRTGPVSTGPVSAGPLSTGPASISPVSICPTSVNPVSICPVSVSPVSGFPASPPTTLAPSPQAVSANVTAQSAATLDEEASTFRMRPPSQTVPQSLRNEPKTPSHSQFRSCARSVSVCLCLSLFVLYCHAGTKPDTARFTLGVASRSATALCSLRRRSPGRNPDSVRSARRFLLLQPAPQRCVLP